MLPDASADLLYLISLSSVAGPGSKAVRKLMDTFGSAAEVFAASGKTLERILDGTGGRNPGTNELRLPHDIKAFKNFGAAEKEIRYMETHRIRALTPAHPDYPKRLLHCEDGPVLLYYQGAADLNRERIISVVGTRKNSEYGRQLTEMLCQGLAATGCTVVSGLAYGIDAIAHQAALDASLETVGVLGHGLKTVYPPRNATLSRAMRQKGGLLTEYSSDSPAIRYQFPQRNRIVAGMSIATVVVESPAKGGSLITAELAEGYNRDVFAFPGRATDLSMAGNHYLIRKNKAAIITGAEDLIEMLNWGTETKPGPQKAVAREAPGFFEQPVLDLLSKGEPVSLDSLREGCGLTQAVLAESLLFLEIKGWIRILPGQRYVLINRNN